jgi:hypothetical protein
MITGKLGTQGGLHDMHRALRTLIVIAVTLALAGGACMPPEELLDEDIGVNLYDRPEDAELENDRERELGDPAEVHGLEATAISGTFQQQLSDTDNAGYLVVDVKLENAASGTTSYDRLDWVLQLPDGTTKNRIAAAGQPDQMEGGDLERDQTLQGKVYFQIGTQRGAFYVLYAPRRAARTNDTEKERGVWLVTVE